MKLYLTLAWRNLWRNKRRTGITIASIVFAVFFSVFMRSTQLGSYSNMIANVVKFYTGYAQIQAEGYNEDNSLENSFEITEELLALKSQHEGIDELVPRLEFGSLVSGEGMARVAALIGIDPVKEATITGIDEKLVDGKYFDADDKSLVLTQGMAENLEATVGDTLVLLGQGYHGISAAGKYPVSGIVKFSNPDLNKRFIFLPLKEAQWFFGAENRATSLVVMTEPEKVDKVIKRISAALPDGFVVLGWKKLLPELVQVIEVDNVGGIIMLAVLYVIVGFGILGTILMMAAERRYEFGILVSVGMRRMGLVSIMVIESLMLTLTGVLCGFMVSFPFIYYLHLNPVPLESFSEEFATGMEKYGIEAVIPFSIELEVFGMQLVAIFIIGLLVSLYPVYGILTLKPTKAMRG